MLFRATDGWTVRAELNPATKLVLLTFWDARGSTGATVKITFSDAHRIGSLLSGSIEEALRLDGQDAERAKERKDAFH